MLLVDTSVWVRFLAGREPFARNLDALLDRQEVLAHELVHGELVVGDRRDRSHLLADYELLVHAPTVPHHEVVAFVRARKLHGRGIGWIDAHLVGNTNGATKINQATLPSFPAQAPPAHDDTRSARSGRIQQRSGTAHKRLKAPGR